MQFSFFLIRYETVNINLQSKPDWFLQRNPLGLVPVLEQDDKIIYESLVCNDYLDEVYPDPPLQPADPYLRAKDKMLIGQFDKVRNYLLLLIRDFFFFQFSSDNILMSKSTSMF